MSLPRTVADVLREHVTLEVEGIDRMYLNVYQPRLQTRTRRRCLLPLPPRRHLRLLGAHGPHEQGLHRRRRALRRAATDPPDHRSPRASARTTSPRSTARASTGTKGSCSSARPRRRRPSSAPRSAATPTPARSIPGSCDRTAMVNHFYFYGVDEDFGPFFLKFCTYFPYNAKLCINGHEYVKRQLAKEGIAFEALDNGILTCADPKRLQQTLRRPVGRQDRRAAAQVAGAPAPPVHRRRTAQAGYRYDVSILQAEFSLTQVLDRPLTGPHLLRGGHPREPRHRPARPGATDLRAARHQADAGPVPHAGAHRGGDAVAARRLQAFADQAVPQGRPRPADRDDDQRHRATSASASGCTTCPPCGRSASRPTDVSWTSNGSARTAPSAKTRSVRSMSRSR